MDNEEITSVIRNLSRPHPSGGVVIERSAILAVGTDSPKIIDWIVAHSGTTETEPPRNRGLHGSRIMGDRGGSSAHPTRFILPPNTLG